MSGNAVRSLGGNCSTRWNSFTVRSLNRRWTFVETGINAVVQSKPDTSVFEFLHHEAAKGQEVFEVFGMKFPAEKVTLWGELLLVGVQLYFLIYLRRLSGKLRADDPGWDVPWIGTDTSPLSQIILFASLVAIPIAAMALLGG